MVLYFVFTLIGFILGAWSCSTVRSLQVMSRRYRAARLSEQRAMMLLAQLAQRNAV